MKKLICVILAASSVFVLASCKKKDEMKIISGDESSDTTSYNWATNDESMYDWDTSAIIASNTSGGDKATGRIVINSSGSDSSSGTASSEREEFSVTIPEGYNTVQIAKRLEEKGVCKATDFYTAVNTFDFTGYELIKNLKDPENRAFKLEGYLYPNTYKFYKNMKASDAIDIMLRGSKSSILGKYSYKDNNNKEYTIDEIITIASIIEKECGNTKYQKMIASVIYNRLNNTTDFPKLEVDATTHYLESYVKPNVATARFEFVRELYSTKRCVGLPLGPICNPGENALKAACAPEKSDCYFFASNDKGEYEFFNTHEEQLEWIKENSSSSSDTSSDSSGTSDASSGSSGSSSSTVS